MSEVMEEPPCYEEVLNNWHAAWRSGEASFADVVKESLRQENQAKSGDSSTDMKNTSIREVVLKNDIEMESLVCCKTEAWKATKSSNFSTEINSFLFGEDSSKSFITEIFEITPTTLKLKAEFAQDKFLMATVFQAFGCCKQDRGRKRKMCLKLSWDEVRQSSFDWDHLWQILSNDLQNNVKSFSSAELEEYLEYHLYNYSICRDCCKNVRKAFVGLANGFKKETDYCKAYFAPFTVNTRQIHERQERCITCADKYVSNLVHKSEQAKRNFNLLTMQNEETHRHATTIKQGQRELLYCIGQFLRHRTLKTWMGHLRTCLMEETIIHHAIKEIVKKIEHASSSLHSEACAAWEKFELLATDPQKVTAKAKQKECKSRKKAKRRKAKLPARNIEIMHAMECSKDVQEEKRIEKTKESLEEGEISVHLSKQKTTEEKNLHSNLLQPLRLKDNTESTLFLVAHNLAENDEERTVDESFLAEVADAEKNFWSSHSQLDRLRFRQTLHMRFEQMCRKHCFHCNRNRAATDELI